MAKFAPVAPIQILEALKKEGVLGNYHLLLAHHVLEYPDRFTELFKDQKNCTIIMDNSIVELGASEGESKVLEACRAIGGTSNWVIPVLTDVMGDGEATRASTIKSYTFWEQTGYPLMAVAQGKDFKDFCLSVDTVFLDPAYRRITYIGIPRKLVESIGSRQLCIQYIEAVRPDISVHLLGFSDDVVDDVICANHPSVEGIDSAVPIRFGYGQDDKVYTPTKAIPPRPADWFEKGEYTPDVFTNLANIRTWVA